MPHLRLRRILRLVHHGERKANNANQLQGSFQSNQGGGGGKKNNNSNCQANNANSSSSGGHGNNDWRRYSKEEWNNLSEYRKKEILRICKEYNENKNRQEDHQANQRNQQASNNGSSHATCSFRAMRRNMISVTRLRSPDSLAGLRS